MKKFLLLLTFFTLLPLAVHADVLTINSAPPEFIKLKQKYNNQKKAVINPQQYKKLQQEYEKDKAKILNSPTYLRQKNVLQTAQAKEVHEIEKKYQTKFVKLKKNAITMVDRKYKGILGNQKQTSQKAILSQYIVSLKRLEDKLIRIGDLAGALVVQTERKKAMQNSDSTISGISEKKSKPKAKTKVTPPAPKQKKEAPKKVTPKAKKKISLPPATSAQVYSSNKKGFAGSGKTSKDNSYTFNINPTQKGAELFFHAYGRKSNDSYGEVFLSTPGGGKYQVAHWSPGQLKKSSFYDVTEAKHVVPITANISKYVKDPGKYTIQFLYRDGNEALIIYKAGIKTK